MVAELNIARGIHADVAGAGANDFESRAQVFEETGALFFDDEIAICINQGIAIGIQDIGCFINLRQVNPKAVSCYAKLTGGGDRLIVGSITGVWFRRVELTHANGAGFPGQAGGGKHRFRGSPREVGTGGDGVGPGLEIDRKIGVDRLQLGQPQ